MGDAQCTIAVVGLGVLGLVTVKNLLEEGFDVTGFDREPFVGGLWHYTEDDRTSVLPTATIINISKERGCFTDFPFPEDTPSHCTAGHVQQYLESYIEHFKLAPHLRLSTSVKRVSRDNVANKWVVDIDGAGSEYFDKVIIATGINSSPHVPKLEGVEAFEGKCLHSRAFKRPEQFKGQKVVVVGLGNTGADTSVSLVGQADKVYLSHNHGAIIMPRTVNGGIPIDHTLTSRMTKIQSLLEYYLPSVYEMVFNAALKKIQNANFKLKPEWKVYPAPSLKHAVPIISDNLVANLESGAVQSVAGIKRVVGPHELELDDGTRLEGIDTIIWATGYRTSFSVLDPEVDPTRHTTPRWAAAKGSRGKPLPRLYQNVISLDHPDSLAFMGCGAFATGAFPLNDVASMALAQVWKGASPLPPRGEMERAVDRQHEFVCGVAESGSAVPGWVRQHEWMAWANAAAGTGVDEYLGWTLAGWKFWYRDREFCRLLVDGIYTPHLFRVFETGKRKTWEGARTEIERVNRAVAAARAARDKKAKAKTV
ncbi:uncharacterized protein E0L32_010191 [Thyridium curvatum]|uniref:Flavin-containing monooxygenase n=1 Tax=Thyridium curvatum TaxID=1093900 RepID=A0A507ANX4_9PEZI|nr:uncharacterized protein E0L32_010191 [Thyridium curvatum]TPX08124.1 hypothetical protein E0L32_010191 [Thyridium curvatum]